MTEKELDELVGSAKDMLIRLPKEIKTPTVERRGVRSEGNIIPKTPVESAAEERVSVEKSRPYLFFVLIMAFFTVIFLILFIILRRKIRITS